MLQKLQKWADYDNYGEPVEPTRCHLSNNFGAHSCTSGADWMVWIECHMLISVI